MCLWTYRRSIIPSTHLFTHTKLPRPPHYTTHNKNRRGHLLATLKEAAIAAGAEVRYGQGLDGFSVDDDGNGGVVVRATTTGGGGELVADVLVGAEGMHSGVRGRLLQQQQQQQGPSGGGGEPASRGYVVYRGVAEAGGRKKALAPGFSFQVSTYTCVCVCVLGWLMYGVHACAGRLGLPCAHAPPTHIPLLIPIHINTTTNRPGAWASASPRCR